MADVRICTECKGSGMVINSRRVEGVIRRRIACPEGHRWTTVEIRPAAKPNQRIGPLYQLKRAGL